MKRITFSCDAAVSIKNRAGRVVTAIKAGAKAVNVPLATKFRCGLANGTHKYCVHATDLSGNAQSKVGSARLTVRWEGPAESKRRGGGRDGRQPRSSARV